MVDVAVVAALTESFPPVAHEAHKRYQTLLIVNRRHRSLRGINESDVYVMSDMKMMLVSNGAAARCPCRRHLPAVERRVCRNTDIGQAAPHRRTTVAGGTGTRRPPPTWRAPLPPPSRARADFAAARYATRASTVGPPWYPVRTARSGTCALNTVPLIGRLIRPPSHFRQASVSKHGRQPPGRIRRGKAGEMRTGRTRIRKAVTGATVSMTLGARVFVVKPGAAAGTGPIVVATYDFEECTP